MGQSLVFPLFLATAESRSLSLQLESRNLRQDRAKKLVLTASAPIRYLHQYARIRVVCHPRRARARNLRAGLNVTGGVLVLSSAALRVHVCG